MRKLSLLSGLLLLLSVSAQSFEISFTDFQGEYVKPEGQATAQTEAGQINFHLLLEEQKLTIKINDDELSIEDAPQMIQDVESFNFDGINLDLAGSVDLTIANFDAVTTTTDLALRTADLKCQDTGAELPFLEKLLTNCLTNGTLDVERLTILEDAPAEDGMRSAAQMLTFVTEQALGGNRDDDDKKKTEFKRLDLDVEDHAFVLKTKADVGIQATITLKGDIRYNQEVKRIELRLDSAKAGFFGIKSQIFELVEGLNSESITVEKPYIYVQIEEQK